jgi:hypothetical protein
MSEMEMFQQLCPDRRPSISFGSMAVELQARSLEDVVAMGFGEENTMRK